MIELGGRRIALIGGAGFMGHHLALHLKAQGADVHVIDGLEVNHLLHFHSEYAEAKHRERYVRMLGERLEHLRAAGVPVHVQDARDYHKLSHILTAVAPQVVVQLAAVAHAGRSNKDPFSTFDHSLRTLENALDWSRDHVEQFVYLSSSMVYGNFRTEQVDEEHPLDPMGIYGALKLAGEQIVVAYGQVFDLPFTIVRPSALYGPRCVSRRVGQIFIENALSGEPLRVDGDGEERLDFTAIDDLVEGLSLTMRSPAALGQTFNLTYGSSRSIRDLVGIVQMHFPRAEVRNVERDRLMPFRGTLSVDKARALLGYQPRFPIEEGFPRYIAWYREFWGPDPVSPTG